MKTHHFFPIALLAGVIQYSTCHATSGGQVVEKGLKTASVEVSDGDGHFHNEVDQPLAMEALSAGERKALLFMREEEKLAHDVYITLNDKWGLLPFSNISRSEQVHMDAILNLLNLYGIEDPARGNDLGVFVDQSLQKLYDKLIEDGSKSVIEALTVGAFIEETDIADIQRLLDEEVDNEDVMFVFSNLKRGSSHHLKAFVWHLERRGIHYTPVVLEKEVFNQMIR